METLGLKNVNMLSKEQYEGITEPATDELYAISGSGFGFPSNRYDDLELGASGTEYVAPANGWLVIGKSTGNAIGDINVYINNLWFSSNSAPSGGWTASAIVPVKKNDRLAINYSASGTTRFFRFYYAEGEN